ncbi:MAG: DUF167 domain-containing protein [Planctomycetota bacterium]|nr:DUF167 domain-containing protein [Planctomycetota bacterium]
MSRDAAVVRERAGGVTVEILASAGASVSKVRGLHGNALKVAVRAPPEKGKANAEIEELLAEFFGVARNHVSVVAGQTARAKRVVVLGITAAQAQARIAAPGG